MANEAFSILLADDDEDDCFLFGEALEEIQVATRLTTVRNGEQLLHLLESMKEELPHVLFLDLNMPRKNGWQCLEEIKRSEKLKKLKVIIFSTSFQQDVADQLYKNGAMHYIRKPGDFSQLKELILQVLMILQDEQLNSSGNFSSHRTKANYVLHPKAIS
jgi:CheY-like chemotaxis protein